MLQRQRAQGWSLIETMIAVVISTLLIAAASPFWIAQFQHKRLLNSAQELAQQIQWMNAEAQSRQQSLRLSLHTGTTGTCYLIHTGPAESCTCKNGTPACQITGSLLKHGEISAKDGLSLLATSSSMLWDPVAGTTTPAGTLKLQSSNGQSLRLVVNILGRIRLCSEASRMSSLPKCA